MRIAQSAGLLLCVWLCVSMCVAHGLEERAFDAVEDAQNGYQIERRANLTYEEFVWKYMARNKPVIITDVVDKWPAFQKWTLEYLNETLGDVDVNMEWGGDKKRKMNGPLRDFVRYMRDNKDEIPIYGEMGVGDSFLGNDVRGLLNDLWIPDYFADDYFVRCTRMPNMKVTSRSFYIGGPRSGIENHQDAYSSYAWSAQLKGRKRWKMYPPEMAHALNFGKLDVFRTNLTEYPAFAYAKGYDFVLEPGELLFWHAPYWHATYVLEESIALSENFLNWFNYMDFKKELEQDCEGEGEEEADEHCKMMRRCKHVVWDPEFAKGPNYTPCKRASKYNYCGLDLPINKTLTKKQFKKRLGRIRKKLEQKNAEYMMERAQMEG